MKLMHIGNIFGDLKNLEHAVLIANQRNLDILVCTGNLLGYCFNSSSQIKKTKELSPLAIMSSAYKFIQKYSPIKGPFSQIFEELRTTNPDLVHPSQKQLFESLQKPVSDYSELEMEFDKNACSQYLQMSEIFQQSKIPVLIIPGQTDSDYFFSYFDSINIHKKKTAFNGVSLAGYGSFPICSNTVPETRKIQFSQEGLYNTLTSANPDIALVNFPPYGFLDSKDMPGSLSLLAYISRTPPTLFLCGNSLYREGQSEDPVTKTRIINISNLGRHPKIKGSGNFAIIDVDDKVNSVEFYKISENPDLSN